MEALNEISLPTVLVTAAAIVSPYLIAIFVRCNMSPKTKQVIAAVVSVVLALGYTVLKGEVNDWKTFWTAAPAIYATSQLMYTLFMKKAAEKIEANVGLTVKNADSKPDKDVVITRDEADLPEDDEDEVTADQLIIVKPEDETPAKG